jgi:glucose/mannose transport system substrate-binding protein
LNRAIFERLGLAPPHTVSELFKVAQKLKEAGITPLSLGTRHPWTAVMVIFECLLVAREGPSFYREYFSGRLEPDDVRIRHTLEESLPLFAHANADHNQRDWVQAADPLFGGQAAMMICGDWTRLLFNGRGWHAATDYREIGFPGTTGTMVFTCDTFALPVDARNKDGARLVLGTMASVEGQRAMNAVKGQLPARLDVGLTGEVDAASHEKLALAKSDAVILALSGMVPRRFSTDLGNAVAEMLAAQDTEPVLQTLRSRYGLLKR